MRPQKRSSKTKFLLSIVYKKVAENDAFYELQLYELPYGTHQTVFLISINEQSIRQQLLSIRLVQKFMLDPEGVTLKI